ncbi:helix-turn-helix transcriptional regulator [Pimelobacter sp. 30-1]|uniref:helix-turn-helix domain-containing protein n=1 Tax=Pimelobacter sp. 30-1 TaxID=2004991 RepID=UPI001C058BF1|nr:helix-turn-helix transcriptional regulator [Pimelobacter sp. 30-1]
MRTSNTSYGTNVGTVSTRLDLAELHQEISWAVLGHRIKTARIAAGLTQAQAVDGQVSAAYLSRIESGERRPEFTLLERIAERVGVSVTQLLTGLSGDRRSRVMILLERLPFEIRTDPAGAAPRTIVEAETLLEGTSDADLQGELALLRALASLAAGDLPEAIEALRAIVAAPSGDAAAAGHVAASTALVEAFIQARRPTDAAAVGAAALDRLEAVGLLGTPEAAALATGVARAHLAGGALDAAEAVVRRVSADTGSWLDLAGRYRAAAEKSLDAGDGHLAVSYAAAAADLEQGAARRRDEARYLAMRGELLLHYPPGPADREAQGVLTTALETLTATDAPTAEADAVRVLLARAALRSGDEEAAVVVLDHWTGENDPADPVVRASSMVLRGQVLLKTGLIADANESFDEAAAALGKPEGIVEDRRAAAAQVWFELGGLHDGLDDVERARVAYRSAAALAGAPTR